MGEDSINPNFKTSTFYGLKPLTKEEILTKLKDDHSIFRSFKRYGLIDCKQYPFINKITFSPDEKNCVEGAKSEEEKLQAKQNLNVIEDYFNSYKKENDKPLLIEFVARDDNECALFNPDRYNYNTLQEKLKEIFD